MPAHDFTADDIDQLDPHQLADFLNTTRDTFRAGLTSEHVTDLRQRMNKLASSLEDDTDTDDQSTKDKNNR